GRSGTLVPRRWRSAGAAHLGNDDREQPAVRPPRDLAPALPRDRNRALRAVVTDGGRRLPRSARSEAAQIAVTETLHASGNLLEVAHLRTHFITDAGLVKAVDDVSFT